MTEKFPYSDGVADAHEPLVDARPVGRHIYDIHPIHNYLSAELEQRVESDLIELERGLASGELLSVPAACLVGFEIDIAVKRGDLSYGQFGYSREQIQANRKILEATRLQIEFEIDMLPAHSEAEIEKKSSWLAQVSELTMEELVLYRIHRRLSRPTLDERKTITELPEDGLDIEDSLEYRFGKGTSQMGWYDYVTMPEIRTVAASPSVAIRRYRESIETARAIANQFGMSFSVMGDHTNFSIWTDRGDGFCVDHGLYDSASLERTRRASGGLLRAINAISPVARSPLHLSYNTAVPTMQTGPYRDQDIRITPNRFEYRRSLGEYADRALFLSALISGYVSAQRSPDELAPESYIDKTHVFETTEGFDRELDLQILRVLQHSEIVDGRIEVDPDYADNFIIAEDIIAALIGKYFYAMLDSGQYKRLIPAMMRSISVEADGTLTCDEDIFNTALGWYSRDVQRIGGPRLPSRIQTIRYAGQGNTIRGAVPVKRPTTMNLHAKLEEVAGDPALQLMNPVTLARATIERGGVYDHETAVASSIFSELLSYNGDSVSLAERWIQGTVNVIAADLKLNRDLLFGYMDDLVRADIARLQPYLDEYAAKTEGRGARELLVLTPEERQHKYAITKRIGAQHQYLMKLREVRLQMEQDRRGQ
jgi:hypothetical protein